MKLQCLPTLQGCIKTTLWAVPGLASGQLASSQLVHKVGSMHKQDSVEHVSACRAVTSVNQVHHTKARYLSERTDASFR